MNYEKRQHIQQMLDTIGEYVKQEEQSHNEQGKGVPHEGYLFFGVFNAPDKGEETNNVVISGGGLADAITDGFVRALESGNDGVKGALLVGFAEHLLKKGNEEELDATIRILNKLRNE